MICYVGKATKIFFIVVVVLVIAGLILGFGVLRHHSDNGADTGPHDDRIPQALPGKPIPATATSAPPLLSPPGGSVSATYRSNAPAAS